MPNVEIVVEASLGDSLVKLDLAEHAVKDLGDSGESTSHKLKEFNASMDDATIASHRAGATISDTEKLIRDAEQAITGTTEAIDGGGSGGGGGGLIGALMAMNSGWQASIPLVGDFLPSLVAMPAVAFAAAVAIVALADAIGTLIAIAADFVAPLTLVTGLLGLLGVGFGLAAKRAAEGGGTLSQFSKELDTLKSMFSKTTDILAHAFLPYLLKLGDAAETALLFIDKLARGSLTNAFRLMSTQGVQMLNSFIQAVANVLAHPIRIAFKIAFGEGKGGNEIASAVAGWWHQFSDYLFGYSNTHQIHIGRFLGPMTHTQVDGIFQPLIDWFDRHHFTKQGIQIGHAILAGFVGSGASQKLGQFLIQVFEDAFKTVLVQALHLYQRMHDGFRSAVLDMAQSLIAMLGQAWAKIESLAKGHLDAIKGAVLALAAVFAGPLVSAVEQVVGAISGIISALNTAVGIAHALASAISAASLGSSNSTAGRTGQGGNSPGNPGGHVVGGHIAVAHFHFHGSNDTASFRRFAREVGREIGRQNHILAGGQ